MTSHRLCLIPKRLFPTRSFLLALLSTLIMVNNLWAADTALDYMELSLEELINIEVVSASKKAQRLSDTDAAVYVITQEDLKRSGITNIPEALRMVPGVQVARIDANKWAISARGFNGRFANKLLVLMDGRSIYTPIFSGVFWDMQDTMMEDIDRIEVIRGPGATLWGANAVNGVINIITKNAADTQGALVTAGGGTEKQGFGAVRFGGKTGEDFYYRLFAKYSTQDDGEYFTGGDAKDGGHAFRTGFRMDWQNKGTLQGEIFKTNASGEIMTPSLLPPYSQLENEDNETNGGHLLGRWTEMFANGSELAVQFFYDRAEYDEIMNTVLTVDTIDFDVNHRLPLSDTQEFIWGVGYRFSSDKIDTRSPELTASPNDLEYHLFSGFLQDEIYFLDKRLRLTLGSKFEHNDFTGFEIQPSARLLWAPERSYSMWASVSRAVRTPTRGETDIQINFEAIPAGAFLPYYPGPGITRVTGSSNFDAEDLLAFELGYRVQPAETLSLDLAIFYNIYDNIRGGVPGTPYLDMSTGVPAMVVPVVMSNPGEVDSYGLELAADWFITEKWKLKGSYAYLKVDVEGNISKGEADNSPRNQVSLKSALNLRDDVQLDLWVRYVDNIAIEGIGSHITGDARLAWQVTNQFEISIVGQNLFDPAHPEYSPQFLATLPTEVERSVYGKLIWHF